MGSSIGTIGQPANAQQAALQQQLLTPKPNANQAANYSPQFGGMVQAPGTSNFAWLPPAAMTGQGGQGLVTGPQSPNAPQSINYGNQTPGGLVYDPNSQHLVVTPQGQGNQSPAALAALAQANSPTGGATPNTPVAQPQSSDQGGGGGT